MAKQTRNNERFTVTVTPESVEAIDILKEEWGLKATSQVVDKAIRESTSALGYSLMPAREEGTMQVTLIYNGKELEQHISEGQTFIEAPREGNYVIRVKNNHWKRRLAVISVDGVNILNGEDAGFDGPGYVFQPWQTIDINGWHRTDEETAAFTFEKVEGSYASQTGRGESNVGVIGIAVFDEKEDMSYWSKKRPTFNGGFRRLMKGTRARQTMGGSGARGMTYGASASAGSLSLDQGEGLIATNSADGVMPCSASASLPEKLGTGYGEKMEMQTRKVDFERASKAPISVMSFQYASRDALIKLGVIQPKTPSAPNPFPAEVGVKAPPGWKG